MATVPMQTEERLELPHADGVLAQHPVQWWYWSGHLQADDGRELGFQSAFFAGEAIRGLLWGQMAHCAIAEPAVSRCLRTGRLWVGAPLRVEGRFALESPCKTMVAMGGDGRERLRIGVGDESLELQLDAEKPATIHYDGRAHAYAFGGYSYHYSRTGIRVEGVYRRGNGKSARVTGRAWFDRQIGLLSPLLLTGWQWFAIQLRGGDELMVFDFNGALDERFAVHVSADGAARTILGKDLQIDILETWRSAKTGIVYPHGWRLKTGAFDIELRPRLCDQEMAGWFTPAYWEGSCDVSGSHEGAAYVELVGGVSEPLQPPRNDARSSEWRSILAHPLASLVLATAAGDIGRKLPFLTPRFPVIEAG